MDKKTKNILRYVFWMLVAALLVYFCIRKIDWTEFRQALAYCRWSYVVLSMLLGVLVFFVRGCRWRMLLLPIDPHTSRITCFNAYNICMAVNLAVPRAGEVARLGYVVKHSSKDSDGNRLMTFDKALGTLLIERIWDVMVTLGMAAVLFIFKWEDFGTALLKDSPSITIKNSLWWILGMGIALVVIFLLLAWKNRSREGFWGKVWQFMEGIGEGLRSFAHMKNAWLFLLETALIWVIYWIMSACIVWAVQDIEAFSHLNMTDAFFLMIAGSISSVVPVPGGFGAYHVVVSKLMQAIWGIQEETAMIFATLNHESQVLSQAVSGLASYIHESFFRRKK